MHQRMGFSIAPDSRLLVLAFTGMLRTLWPGGNRSRRPRDYKDGSFGPFISCRYNSRSGWGESNTGFPFYKHRPTKGSSPPATRCWAIG